jgi:ribosome-binding factor A
MREKLWIFSLYERTYKSAHKMSVGSLTHNAISHFVESPHHLNTSKVKSYAIKPVKVTKDFVLAKCNYFVDVQL